MKMFSPIIPIITQPKKNKLNKNLTYIDFLRITMNYISELNSQYKNKQDNEFIKYLHIAVKFFRERLNEENV
jgi:nitrate reductase beta subunit